jgi:hypothetical protein
MPGLAPFQPDNDYCVFCHRPAAGRCAVCHALICAECAELVPGLSRPLAVCRRCARRDLHPGRLLLAWLLIPAVLLAAAAALIIWLR